MDYEIKITGTAKNQLAELPPGDQEELIAIINALAHNPIPPKASKAPDMESGFYRITSDDFLTILYEVDEEDHSVLVLQVQKEPALSRLMATLAGA